MFPRQTKSVYAHVNGSAISDQLARWRLQLTLIFAPIFPLDTWYFAFYPPHPRLSAVSCDTAGSGWSCTTDPYLADWLVEREPTKSRRQFTCRPYSRSNRAPRLCFMSTSASLWV
ncbi:unnamed protein product [Protopolystoma xenopodis]|uniref:Uncharacterized protein n=1 Tax=Protopolystoma xenopodis TaxID=117903 RepID=A0A3S5B0Z8_9PLAT|nr:unnamed protein product [Protopolystoma xenopodis]